MKKIFANLKMNMTYDETLQYLSEIVPHENLIICPSSLYLSMFSSFHVASQDVSIYLLGAHTGDIGAQQLSAFTEYVMIGHSERREAYQENNSIIRKKIDRVLENNMKVVLCVGEKKGEDKEQILKEQLAVLESLSLENIIIAYEPIWAIGTGVVPSNEQIEESASFIKKILNSNVEILYGGSVDDSNINSLNEIKELSGFLVGKASCDSQKLKNMIEILQK